MKNLNLITLTSAVVILLSVFAFTNSGNAPIAPMEFTSFTVIESIVPNGFGRSRIITALEKRDYKEFTTVQSDDDKTRNKSDRGDIRVENFEETKLLNFYNIGGIRFQNIAANDALVNSKVNTMLNEGWQVVSITAGVESKGGKDDSDGIYVTRFYFQRAV
ncbi:MAG: hypothetical protein ACJAU0_001778 [Flavobacteriales bacterium]|jgi:hypothetical protein